MDDVDSEILVQSKHQDIHRTARAVLEVRRILVEHLRKSAAQPALAGLLTLPQTWSNQANSEQFNSRLLSSEPRDTGVVQASFLTPDDASAMDYNTTPNPFPNFRKKNRPAPIVRLTRP